MAQVPPKPPYDEFSVDESQQQNRGTVEGRIMPNGTFGPGEKEKEQEVFNAYFKGYILPRWSVVKTVTSLPNFRVELRRHFQRCSMSGRPKEIHDYLGDMVLTWMDGYARSYAKTPGDKNFHPAVRVNAMLMIGELNQEEKGSQSDPLPDALPVMLAALNEPEYIDAVRVAAMIGIARHAEAGIADQAVRTQVGSVMLALLKSPCPAGRTADGHAWLRAQAAEVLGQSGMASGAVATEMAKIVADSQVPFSARCVVAKAMGNKLNLAGMDAQQLATALGQMAVEACRREGPQDQTQRPEDYPVSRRRLMARLDAVTIALKAVAGAATDASQKDFVADVKSITESLVAILDDTTVNDLDLLNLVLESETELRRLLGQDTAPPVVGPSITGL